ncbi:uncharacterized protein BDZ99DRAFT_574543 [Mytilinidion resinicola]|uniref:Uncharacterized protein n=1 Tax=Mytilinidion resinicola TaxID=574789 RepID=A0A6A6YAQ6_9PEZI|nr:uncharacterized protein BDZ99DRAFT_574543 [Mytilinidion resinicola]KAF2805658.1 hypothetical protein BDZ99DRAFT_574543 [Mytilinidion resinicola]
MDDSPRQLKRRKLDAPSRNVSSPLPSKPHTPGTLRRSTRRITSLHNAENHASAPANGSPRARRSLTEEKDVYDNVDGALDTPAKRLRERLRTQFHESDPSPKKTGSAPKEPVSRTRGGKEFGNGTTNGTSKRKWTSRTAGSETKSGASKEVEEAVETDGEDELAAGLTTPSSRKIRKEAVNGTNGRSTPFNPRTRTSTRIAAHSNPNRAKGHVSPSPSGAMRRRQPQAALFTHEGSEDQEEMDLVDADADSHQGVPDQRSEWPNVKAVSKARATGRRTRNRADHDENAIGSPLLGQNNPTTGRRKRNNADHDGIDTDLPHSEESGLESEVDGIVGMEKDDVVPGQINGNIQDDQEQSDGEIETAEVLEETSPFLSNRNQGRSILSPRKKVQADSNGGLTLLKSIVVERLTAKRPTPLVGLDDEYRNVYQLVENTVVAGEGNSMLVIGARGSGKTALVSKVLSGISKEHREEFHTVRLNGFIHTDDKLALREIWRQLGKEMELEEDSLGKNYADTLSKLLALLSHPSEQTGEETEQVAKAVVFVMDEFDLFALHPRQTLLYNLFDIAQSRKAPIAVLGLTTRIDVSESLEKRVKSRFSHRYVHLSLPKTFTAFQETCKAALSLQLEDLNIEERAILSKSTAVTPKTAKNSKPANILAAWNSSISTLFATKAFITSHLGPIYYRSKSIKEVLTSLLTPTALLAPSTFPPSPSAFFTPNPSIASPTNALAPPDSKLALLPNLSHVQLALLIAAARLDVVLDTDTCNFNMAYAEYVSLAAKVRMQSAAGGAVASGGATRVWGKEVAMREWERLVRWELVVPVVGLGAGAGGAGAMVRVDMALEEIIPSVQAAGGQMDRVLEKWCRQI